MSRGLFDRVHARASEVVGWIGGGFRGPEHAKGRNGGSRGSRRASHGHARRALAVVGGYHDSLADLRREIARVEP